MSSSKRFVAATAVAIGLAFGAWAPVWAPAWGPKWAPTWAPTWAPPAAAQVVSEPRSTRSEIDWEAARRDAARVGIDNPRPGGETGSLSFGGLEESETNDLAIPLLLPLSLLELSRLGQLDEPMEMSAREDDYSALARIAPRQYQIQGTRIVFETGESGAFDPDQPPSPPVIEFLEYGSELSFERYGAVYSITIYCAAPLTDPECAEEGPVRRLFSEMTFAE